jgi:hypothetical protein
MPSPKLVFSGAGIWKRTAAGSGGFSEKVNGGESGEAEREHRGGRDQPRLVARRGGRRRDDGGRRRLLGRLVERDAGFADIAEAELGILAQATLDEAAQTWRRVPG